MRLALIVTIQSASDVEVAARLVAGRPWLVRLVERLSRATSVARVCIACRQGEREIDAIVRQLAAPTVASPVLRVSIFATDDPMALAAELDGDHDAVALCPVTQLFADPAQLDRLAALDTTPDIARAIAVLSSEPSLALTGGPFLEVFTRKGLRDAIAGVSLTSLKTTTLPAWPGPPEMQIESQGDVDWAVLAEEALLTFDASGNLTHFEAAIGAAGLRRFGFWDQMGPAPASILTVRCERLPLFEQFVRYLRRLPGATIDVVCRAALADETRSVHGVGRVFAFDAPAFGNDALDAADLSAIHARHYELCIIPRREPTGWGFENLVLLAQLSGAGTGIWVDIFGRTGLLAGRSQGWDPACIGGPHERAQAYLRRAVGALDVYKPVRLAS